MRDMLIVIDMQKDFITGPLGTPEAEKIVPAVKSLIKKWDDALFATLDTHGYTYLETHEGKNLPVPHCIEYTDGWLPPKELQEEYSAKKYVVEYVRKSTFGTFDLFSRIDEYYDAPPTLYLCGVCTDICVVSNALSLRAKYPESDIYVIEDCCAGTNPEKHKEALSVMRSCHIKVIKSKDVFKYA